MGLELRHEICKAKWVSRTTYAKPLSLEDRHILNQIAFQDRKEMYLCELYMSSDEGQMDCTPIKITK